MAFDVAPAASEQDFREALFAIGQYFGGTTEDEMNDVFLKTVELDRMHAARENGTIVGGAGAFTFELTVPGGSVPCAGVTTVGVYPTHRRRGVLRAMMRAQLDDVHRRGEPIAALWASEETIYGRYGYAIAAWAGEISIPREHNAFAAQFEREGSIRFITAEEALDLFPPVYHAARGSRVGMHSRTRDWWQIRLLADPPDRRRGAGPKRFIVHETAGSPTGYAMYRHKPSFEAGSSTAQLSVIEAFGVTPAATREVWRYLLDIDWSATLEASLLPPDHPLFLLLATPRRAKYRMGDGIWLRVVDVGAALSARSYGDGGPIVLEVRDAFCEWNDGRWRVADGRVERTDDDPDLRLDADALGSAYLGGVSFAELEHALRVEAVTPDAVARADALFSTPLHPWCPEIF
jgi:predicted acetyltransferase